MVVPVHREQGLLGSLDEALAQELAPIYCLWLGKEDHLIAEDTEKCGADFSAVKVGKGLSFGFGQSQLRSGRVCRKAVS